MKISKADTFRVYQAIVALSVVSAGALLAFHLSFQTRDSEYAHRLVNYGHGVIRRALVGEIYSLFLSRIPPWVVDLEGAVTVAVATWLGWKVFTKVFQVVASQKIAIACFVFGSPFLFKNYLGTLGKFDVLGACVAMLAALLPLHVYTFILVGALSAVLLMVHHIHATLFVPTIYGTLLIRALAASWCSPKKLFLILISSIAALAVLFFALLLFANPSITPEEFRVFLRSRATVPVAAWVDSMWFSTISQEIGKTRQMFPTNIMRLPVYLLLVAIHLPIIFFFRRRLAAVSLAKPGSAVIFHLVIAVVLAGYLMTMFIAFDYARFVSDFAFCLSLLTAVQILSVAGPIKDASDFRSDDIRVILLAIAVAAVPYVGMITPAIGDFAFPKFGLVSGNADLESGHQVSP